tara:strand:- start:645 stop:1715 length:1071 start_codon:yes stop_codon:yes gene_type:complete
MINRIKNTLIKNILDPFKAKMFNRGTQSGSPSNLPTSGVVDFDPGNIQYFSGSKKKSGVHLQYPMEPREQEHYMLLDIVTRQASGAPPSQRAAGLVSRSAAPNITNRVANTNRFFGEGGGKIGMIPTGIGSARSVLHTIAIYMPQTLKFQFAADYGAAEIGMLGGFAAKLKDAFTTEGGFLSNLDTKSLLAQGGKAVEGAVTFGSLGTAEGLGAAIQRRTNIAPAAMTEMIFNGIDYRTFSFEFKFTPTSAKESELVHQILHYIKESMLPEKVGGSSIAAFTVPNEFVIRFMQGTKINPYIDQIGLCACTGVDITYGGDKFSTHPSGDPVTIDATLTFRELELVERTRYNNLRGDV